MSMVSLKLKMKPLKWALLGCALLLMGTFFSRRVATESCPQQSYPHAPRVFTQGLLFADGILYESTGRYGGHSSVRRVDLASGEILQKHSLPADVFGEGLALHQGVLYQLTWHNGIVFKYAPDTLEQRGQIKIEGEAWGLASDGERLVMSDGSAVLRFVDPADFHETGRILVRDAQGQPVTGLNELEFAQGFLLANVYPTPQAVVIDPANGRVVERIDLSRLIEISAPGIRECIPNGIAYQPETGCLLVTGKNCSRLLQIPFPLK